MLTKRKTIVLIRKTSHKPGETHQCIAPGGAMAVDDHDEIIALRRELRAQLGAEVHIISQAMSLFMDQWYFYLCGLLSVDPNQRTPEHTAALKNGDYEIIELRLNERAIREANIQPRALFDYLLANHHRFFREETSQT